MDDSIKLTPIKISYNITDRGIFGGKVLIGDTDISHLVSSASVKVEAGHVPRIVLEVVSLDEIEFDCDACVEIHNKGVRSGNASKDCSD